MKNQNGEYARISSKVKRELPSYEDIRLGKAMSYGDQKQKIDKPQIHFSDQKQSPIGQKPQKQHQSVIVSHIRVIFMFYVQFGNKTNILYLKSSKFIKIMADANLISQQLSNKDLDILYFQTTKNTEILSLEQFQDLLLRIAVKLYPMSEKAQSFNQLYKNHLQQLYNKIIDQTDFGKDLKTIEEYRQQIDERYDEFISAILGVVSKIHAFVFHNQSQKLSQIQSQYMHFLQSFEIIPLIITQTKGQLLFFDLINRESILNIRSDGKYLFPLSKFLESLLIISMHEETEVSLPEQFYYFLERLEASPGFEEFSKSHYQTKNETNQLVMALSRVSSVKQSRVSTIHNQIENKNDQIDSVPYEKELKNLFEYYSQIGEPLNLINLKSIKYKKLLQNAGIIGNIITQVDADMIYIQSTPKKKLDSIKSPKFKQNKLYDNDNQNGKLDFPNFLLSLKLIADKFLQGQIKNLVEEYLIPLENQIKKEKQEEVLQILMVLLNDPNIVKLYEIMQQHFEPYYFHYTKDLLTLSGFMKFCQDFELANSLISKGQLMHIFRAISQLNQLDTIDKNQFVEAISVIAMLVYNNIDDNSQKIIYLLERMTQSDGAIKASKQLGIVKNPQKANLLQLFRQQSAKDIQQPEEQNFNDIMNQLE